MVYLPVDERRGKAKNDGGAHFILERKWSQIWLVLLFVEQWFVLSPHRKKDLDSTLRDDPAIEWKLVQGVTGHWDSFQSLKTKTKLWKRNITSVEEMSEQNPVGLKLNWEVNQLRWDLKTLLDVKVLFGKVNKLYTRGHDTPKTSLCLAANWHRSLPPQTAVSH